MDGWEGDEGLDLRPAVSCTRGTAPALHRCGRIGSVGNTSGDVAGGSGRGPPSLPLPPHCGYHGTDSRACVLRSNGNAHSSLGERGGGSGWSGHNGGTHEDHGTHGCRSHCHDQVRTENRPLRGAHGTGFYGESLRVNGTQAHRETDTDQADDEDDLGAGSLFAMPRHFRRDRAFGWDTLLAIATLLLSILMAVIADILRPSSDTVGNTSDVVFLVISTVATSTVSIMRVYTLWSNLGNYQVATDGTRTMQPLKRTMIDVASVYLGTLISFGNGLALADLGGDSSGEPHYELFPGATNRLVIRLIDAFYIITFVATGVGFPNGTFHHTSAARGVAWGCALVVSTFVGKVLVSTALSARLSQASGPQFGIGDGMGLGMGAGLPSVPLDV
jgi:hypothetical protein